MPAVSGAQRSPASARMKISFPLAGGTWRASSAYSARHAPFSEALGTPVHNTPSHEPELMIRHIVMWRVQGDTPSQRAATSHRIKQAFEGLRGRIPGMKLLEVGIDVSEVDYACDVVLLADFESPQALHNYAEHPEHLRVRRELEGLRIARHQVDYPRLP